MRARRSGSPLVSYNSTACPGHTWRLRRVVERRRRAGELAGRRGCRQVRRRGIRVSLWGNSTRSDGVGRELPCDDWCVLERLRRRNDDQRRDERPAVAISNVTCGGSTVNSGDDGGAVNTGGNGGGTRLSTCASSGAGLMEHSCSAIQLSCRLVASPVAKTVPPGIGERGARVPLASGPRGGSADTPPSAQTA